QQLVDPFHHFPNGTNLPGRFVGNVEIELALEREQDIDPVQRIDLKFGEGLVDGDGLGRDLLSSRNHVRDACDQFFRHSIWLTVSNLNPRSLSRGSADSTASSVARMSGA